MAALARPCGCRESIMLRALIIEDKDRVAKELKMRMERDPPPGLHFSTVDIAGNCREARRLASSGVDYDLIIYDVNLPFDENDLHPTREEGVANGMQLVRDLQPLQPLACGIMTSAYLTDEDAFAAGSLGAVRRFVSKPATPSEILIVAKAALDEAMKRSAEVREQMSASYLRQAQIHETMNSLNNILAASSEIKRLCAAGDGFVSAQHLPAVLEEVENIHRFQEAAASALRQIPVQTARRSPCHLDRIVDWCVRHLITEKPKAADRISMKFDDAIPPTLGVMEELQHIVLILVNNSLRAIEDDGNVEISLRHESGGERSDLVLEVVDDGRGIPESQRDRLFDPTVRGDGHGLGLFLARAFAWNHGGKIQLHSGAQGHGTKVVVTLPLRGVDNGQ